MRQANALGAARAAILGAEELASDTITLRDLATSEQERLSLSEALQQLRP
jgi:histidyl-tRNA synthetase